MSVNHATLNEKQLKLQISPPIRLVLDSSLTVVCLTGDENLDGDVLKPGWFIQSVNGQAMSTLSQLHQVTLARIFKH